MADNTSQATPEKQPATALVAADVATPNNQVATTEAADTSPTADGDVVILSHIERVYRNSETRTPIVAALSDSDPYPTVVALARRSGCAVWSIQMGSERNERNALDYVEVGTQNGDWVYLTNVEQASAEVLRQIALTLYTLKPEPKAFPRRSLFRLFLITDTPIHVNDTIRPGDRRALGSWPVWVFVAAVVIAILEY